MNRELVGLLAKWGLTHQDVALWINKSRSSVTIKIKEGNFNQREQSIIVDKLRQYDREVDMNVFYLQTQLHNV